MAEPNGKQRFFDHHAGTWEHGRRDDPLVAGLVESMPLAEGDLVIEPGCGTGLVSELIVQKIGPTGKLLALDISPRMIELALEKKTGACGRVPRCRCAQGAAERPGRRRCGLRASLPPPGRPGRGAGRIRSGAQTRRPADYRPHRWAGKNSISTTPRWAAKWPTIRSPTSRACAPCWPEQGSS